MTKDEIQKHLESLNKRIVLSSRTVTHKCRPIINGLLEHQFGWVFKDPVDPVALGLPDYFDVIKSPMHLELVRKKLENAIYSDMEGFARDARLVFQNAILYNGESSEVGELAQSMLNTFEKAYRAVVKGMSIVIEACLLIGFSELGQCYLPSFLLLPSQILKRLICISRVRANFVHYVENRSVVSNRQCCTVKGNAGCSESREMPTTTLTKQSKTTGANRAFRT